MEPIIKKTGAIGATNRSFRRKINVAFDHIRDRFSSVSHGLFIRGRKSKRLIFILRDRRSRVERS